MQLKALYSGSALDRTLDNIARHWHNISLLGAEKVPKFRPELPDSDLKRLRKLMQNCLETRGGEVPARAQAAGLGHAYLELNDEGRYRFLKLIADEYGIDKKALQYVIDQYLERDSDALLEQMRDALRPPWIKLFTQFNALPSGVRFLVDMRADLIRYNKTQDGLKALDSDLRQLLVSWFDIGFLDLKRITWNEPASLLEKLIAYEAVHEIQSWDDLKNRLDIDRCCYAFFHPRMPNEPLIFVQVALVNGISTNIHELLDDAAPVENPKSVDTAIFYSITNTQLGLRGVSLGDFLIKRVVDDLTALFPNLKTFATLSPVPGFVSFINQQLKDKTSKIDDSHKQILEKIISGDLDSWYTDKNLSKKLKPALMNLCSQYLINEKRGLGVKDSVANFHLNNGARIEQINWLGDCSAQGMARSFGLMVNYYYKLSDIEKNHEAYVAHGEVNYSSSAKALLKKSGR